MDIKISLSRPDAEQILLLLETSPDAWPDVIEDLRAALDDVGTSGLEAQAKRKDADE